MDGCTCVGQQCCVECVSPSRQPKRPALLRLPLYSILEWICLALRPFVRVHESGWIEVFGSKAHTNSRASLTLQFHQQNVDKKLALYAMCSLRSA